MSVRFSTDELDAMRRRLPEYLRKQGLELKEKGGRLVAACPNHEDKHPSFAVFPKKQHCGCFPCAWQGDVFDFAIWTGKAGTFPEAVREVAGVLGVTLHDDHASPPRAATTSAKPVSRPAPQAPKLSEAARERIHLARLRFSDAFHAGDDIIDRISSSLGFSLETLRQATFGDCGLGLDAPAGIRDPWICYAYPSGLKYRNPHRDNGPRFVWLVGKAAAPWRMGWVKPDTRTVYLTEGESDCLALIQSGIEDDGQSVCVASPGTSFPREWAPLFRGKRVVICFDIDKPGRVGTATVAAILKGHASEILTWKGNPQ